eukprot:6023904-Amphidinium_carterae.1
MSCNGFEKQVCPASGGNQPFLCPTLTHYQCAGAAIKYSESTLQPNVPPLHRCTVATKMITIVIPKN